MRDGKWHFSQTFLKQATPIGIIDVPTTCNHNIKSHGTNICNLFHCFYFLIRKFPTHKYFKFWTYFKVGYKILTLCPLVVDFCQPFNNCNIKSRNHKDGNTINYQLLFTKPKTTNVFDQHCCKPTNIVHFNQLHVLCKEFKIKW